MHHTTIKITFIVLASALSVAFLTFQQAQFDLKGSIARGQEVYSTNCMSCHMDNGEGIDGAFPPLAKSDYLMKDKKRSIKIILEGQTGEIVVNGKTYNSDMPPLDLSDREVSDVLNYIRNTWGNKGDAITPDEVRVARSN